MIADLLKRRDGERWDGYWFGKDGLMKLVRRLDEERNRIVHWHPVDAPEGDDLKTALRKPNFWATGSEKAITEEGSPILYRLS